MCMIMYSVLILSTICLVILRFAGPIMLGLVIFYLSAGFFVVFFTASFMEIARYSKTPELLSGVGRAVNNFVAVLIYRRQHLLVLNLKFKDLSLFKKLHQRMLL